MHVYVNGGYVWAKKRSHVKTHMVYNNAPPTYVKSRYLFVEKGVHLFPNISCSK